MNNFVKGMLISGAAPVAIGVGAAVAYRSTSDVASQILLGMLWVLGLVAFVACLVIGLRTSVGKTRDGRAGVLAGFGLALVAMGTTCFAMLNT
jgi:hypothetical protein